MPLLSKDTFSQLGLLLLRVGLGVNMAVFHGLERFRQLSERAGGLPDPLGIGHRNSLVLTVSAQLFCAAMLVIGLASRLAALALSFVMGLALFIQQAPDPWQKRELAALYFAGFLTILFLGPGRLSLDAVMPKLFGRKGGGSRVSAARFPSPSR